MTVSEKPESTKSMGDELDFRLTLKKIPVAELENAISEAVSKLAGERYSCEIKSVNFSIPAGAALELNLSFFVPLP